MLNKDFANGAENTIACIFSVEGNNLSEREISLFRDARPFGFVLFKRNCKNPNQLKGLIAEIKNLIERDCPILIDQEGGRVQRLCPPYWRDYKPMRYFGDMYQTNPELALEELKFETLRLAEELADMGVNVNCAPVLDLYFEGAHDIIGDRAFSCDPDIISRLGVSVCRDFLNSGITPIIKHIPGHGRAQSDSHLELPVINTKYDDLSKLDFAPFRDIASSDIGNHVWAMTAHITYNALDKNRPVCMSPKIINDIIRKDIGFDGILIGDDLDMKALNSYGTASEKTIETLRSGCDLALYCAGDFDVMQELAQNTPKISKKTLERLQNG